ncbi:MAG: AAA family ATPase [Clostridium sp.]|nr:AAA family ATPase [Clostridium sp.]
MSRKMILNENSRKSATKLLLVNWSRFSHVSILLEGSTLFTGVNGSGKSTILDAMTYMLTGNTQFNKAALDRDRNVISYVRGDTKSEGKSRFIREGEVISYIAMEFWSPLDEQYLVVGVCIEYINEGSNSKKWFVLRDTKIDDCIFYKEEGDKVIVFPHNELMIKGKKIPASDFMNRDKGTDQLLRALGLRCGVGKYKAKLVKMMAFNPENNIDRFIQECVLDEHPIHAMDEIREHRQHYNDAKAVYEELANGKQQLDVVQQRIRDYEEKERRYEIRRILLLYQEVKWLEECQNQSEQSIQRHKAKKQRLQCELKELKQRRGEALDRKIKAENNDLLRDVGEIIKDLEERIKELENKITNLKNKLSELQMLETQLQNILEWLECEAIFSEKEKAVISAIAASSFSYDEKIDSFIRFKKIVEGRKDGLQKDKYNSETKLKAISDEKEELQKKIKSLKTNVLPFDRKYEEAIDIIKNELKAMNIKTDVRLFAELVREINPNWQMAIETFLGNKRFDIIVDADYCEKAMEIVHKHHMKGIKIVITDQLPRTEIQKESAAAMLEIPNEYGRRYANYLLNGIHLCENIHELHEYPKGGLMMDGTLAKSFAMSCMNMNKTQVYMGKDAAKKQLEQALKNEKDLYDEEEKENEILEIIKKKLNSIEIVDWDEKKYIFDAQLCIDKNQKELKNKNSELENIKNAPGFAAAMQEKENAEKEYNDVDKQYITANSDFSDCEKEIDRENRKLKDGKEKIKAAEKEYNEAVLSRLELRKYIIELYEKLRKKSRNAYVMTPKHVDNIKSEKDSAIRSLEDEQRKYWHIMGQSDEKYGIGYIGLFREQYKEIANVKIEEAKQKLEEQKQTLESIFMVDFIAALNEAISEARSEIDEINKELKNIPFGKDTYQFKMDDKPEREVFFKLCKKLEGYMFSPEAYRSRNQHDEEMEYDIKRFMDIILEEENEDEYTDYRKYFKYDMKIRSRQDDDETTTDLSKKQGSASNGEKQTPYFIILAASLMQCYPRNVCCARLAFIDEAFSALSRERIEQMVKFFEDNQFQVIYAAPPEKIDSIGSHINSTVSLCTKGKYTWAVEGLVKLDEFEIE